MDPKTSFEQFVAATMTAFESMKSLAERAIAQLSDEKLHTALDANTNNIAVIMKHISGNLRSRWTEPLTSDGEKSWRNRDEEFLDDFESREQLHQVWQRGWECLYEALRSFTVQEASKTLLIRGEPHTLFLAMQRSLSHTSYHVGQIVQLARVLAEEEWETLTIPRGGSEAFNERMRRRLTESDAPADS